jgi:RNA polymerase sigma-70 factor (ECF subfamily)
MTIGRTRLRGACTGLGPPGEPFARATSAQPGQRVASGAARWEDHWVEETPPHEDTSASAVSELKDGQLLVALGRADAGALHELYRRHGRAVYALARRVVGNAAEAEDVTQEIFLHLWEHPERVDLSRGALRTYLLTRTHSRAVDLVRSRAARARREERDARMTSFTASDLEREVWELSLAEQMSSAVATLPPDERAAIELAYFDGHTYREVAQLLTEPEGTVKSRIRRGLGRLREVLEGVDQP